MAETTEVKTASVAAAILSPKSEPPKAPEKELSFDDIMESNDIEGKIKKFKAPEWGGHIFLRPLAAVDVIQFNKEMRTKSRDDAMVALFCKAACRSDGVLLVKGQESMRRLQEKSTAPFVRAQNKIMQMNGMMSSPKTWEELLPLLEKAGVDSAIIKKIQTEWETDEDDPKNA